MEKAKTNAKDTAERKAAVRQKAAAIASCVVLALSAFIYLSASSLMLCYGLPMLYFCAGVINASFLLGFAFRLKPFNLMRAVSFAFAGFVIYCGFSLPSFAFIPVAFIVWTCLMTALLSYKPPVWCSVLLGILGALPTVLFIVIGVLITLKIIRF